jgi:hypothetical protein
VTRSATAAALLLLASACAEDSSYVLRWKVGREAPEALTSVRQCSDLGLSKVRVSTFEGAELVDSREFPCFPDSFADPDGVAPGPELGPGTYTVTVLGLTRRGLARPDPEDPNNDDLVLARDSATVRVAEKGEGQLVDGFELLGIGECGDGVDNDRDGAVDQADAPCRLGLTSEADDVAGALFTFDVVLLPGNPAATCAGLGLDRFRVLLDGDVAGAREVPCSTLTQSFTADLAPGEHTWAVEGLGPGGEVRTERLTGEPFTVAPTGFVFAPIAVEFGLGEFLGDPPFADPLRFTLEFEPYPGAGLAGSRVCAPEVGVLALGEVAVTLLGDGEPVTDVTVPKLMDAAFPLTQPCDEQIEQQLTTSDLTWSVGADGHATYHLQVEAFAAEDDGGGPCFSNRDAPAQLAPNTDLRLRVPRVRSDGACADCPTGDECGRCEAGVCLP